MAESPAVYFAPDAAPLPELARCWFDARGLTPVLCRTLDELMAMALRGRPLVVIFDARTEPALSCACLLYTSDAADE